MKELQKRERSPERCPNPGQNPEAFRQQNSVLLEKEKCALPDWYMKEADGSNRLPYVKPNFGLTFVELENGIAVGSVASPETPSVDDWTQENIFTEDISLR